MSEVSDLKYAIKFDDENPPPGYRGPEVETIREALARLRSCMISRIPTRGVSAVTIHCNQSVHTAGEITMKLSSLTVLRKVKDNKAIIDVTAPKDQAGVVTTSHVFDVDGEGGIFPPNIPLAVLNNNQRFHIEIHIIVGDNNTFLTGFNPVTVCNFYQTGDGGYHFQFELVTGIYQAREIYNIGAEICIALSRR